MVDLHIHTKYSDGEYDEKEIVDKIREAGVKEFSICDHDTIEGSEKVYELVKDNPEFVFHSGVELSSFNICQHFFKILFIICNIYVIFRIYS